MCVAVCAPNAEWRGWAALPTAIGNLTTAEAVGEAAFVYATTARPRDMLVNVATPEEAATQIRADTATGAVSGVLFGPESSGMENDDIVLADTVLTVPLNPGFSSLNLAQAVFAVGYCWYRLGDTTPPRRRHHCVRRRGSFEEQLTSGIGEVGPQHGGIGEVGPQHGGR